MNIIEFVHSHKVTMTYERTVSNPHMEDSQDMDHWKCRLRTPRHSMTVCFSKGVGHKGKPPELGEVLDCLASDAAGYENAKGFEDWASGYGYDPDSRKAERTYKIIERQAVTLKRLLGEEGYKALLWKAERE